MDFIKKGANALSNKQNSGVGAATGDSNNTANTGTTGTAGAGQQDYADKAFAAGSKKAGYNLDPSTSEKITDGARGAYEKATGSKVDSKYSN